MAEKKETVYKKPTNKEEPKATKENLNERVPVYIPRGMGDRIVGVNGKLYQLPEGQTSQVPKFVANEIARSEEAQNRYDLLKAQLLGQGK